MKKIIAAAVMLIAAQAHAQSSHRELAAAQPQDTCYSQAECDTMWAKAQRTIEEQTHMQIRLLTADRIETYPDRQHDDLVAAVTKTAVGPDAYKITARYGSRYGVYNDAMSNFPNTFAQMIHIQKMKYAMYQDGMDLRAKGLNVPLPDMDE